MVDFMRERVMVQFDDGVATTKGGLTEVWTDLVETWMKIEPLSPARNEQGVQVAGVNGMKFTTRFREDLQAFNADSPTEDYQRHYRLQWRSRNFSIGTVRHLDPMRMYIEIIAFEKRP